MSDVSFAEHKYYYFFRVAPSASIAQLEAGWDGMLSCRHFTTFRLMQGASLDEIREATDLALRITHPDNLPARLKADPAFVTYSGLQFEKLKKRAKWLLAVESDRAEQYEFRSRGHAPHSGAQCSGHEMSGKSSGGGASARDSFDQRAGSTRAGEWDVLPSTKQEAIKGIARCEWRMGALTGFSSSGHFPFVGTTSSNPQQEKYLRAALKILGVDNSFDPNLNPKPRPTPNPDPGSPHIQAYLWDAIILRGYLRQQGAYCNVLDAGCGVNVSDERIRLSESATVVFEHWLRHLVRDSLPLQKSMLTTYNQGKDLALFCQNGEYATKGMIALGFDPIFDIKTGITHVTGKEASRLFDELALRDWHIPLESGSEQQVARAYEVARSLLFPHPSPKAKTPHGPSFG